MIWIDQYQFPTGPQPPISSNLWAWYDPSYTDSVSASGGRVSQIDDLTGHGYHLTASSGLRPYTGRTFGGLDVLDFQSGQYMRHVASIGFDTTTFTVFIVTGQDSGAASSQGFLTIHDTTGNDWDNPDAFIIESSNSTNQMALTMNAFGPQYGNGGGLTEMGTWAIRKNTVANQTEITGPGGVFALGSIGANGIADGGVLVGSRFLSGAPDAAFNLDGPIGEILIYTDRKNDIDQATIRNYLIAKWGA